MDKRTADAIEKLVADWPPLSEETKVKLGSLLGPDASADTAPSPGASPAPDDIFPLPEGYSEEPQPFSDEQKATLRELFYRGRPE